MRSNVSFSVKQEEQEDIDQRVDQVIADVGGFGRYQWLVLASYFCFNKSVALLLVSMSFLSKVPQEYFCKYANSPNTEVICKPANFCDNESVLSYRPNMALSDSYDNWVGRFGLECASKSKIGFLGSSFFIGWIVTLTFLPRLSDLYGRQKIIVCGNIGQFIAYTMIIATRSYTVLVAALILMGTMATIRTQVSVIYLYEIMKKKHYTLVFSCGASVEGLVGVLASLYFMYISKSSKGLLLTGYIIQIFGNIGSFFYLESPRFLIKSDQL